MSPGRGAEPGRAPNGPAAAVDYARSLLIRCTFPPPGTAVSCGVSGGPDSSALLVLATEAGCRVTAVHVDHGLRSGSEVEADVVAALADRCGAGFRSVRVRVGPGPNLAARARQARYEALGTDACVGHTADDQAETVLLALLRGGAWWGLGGMEPGVRRPILGLRRSETERLCELAGIEALDDPSNADPTSRRSRVRHELLPLLANIAERDPVPVLIRQAELLRGGGAILAAAAAGLDPTDAKALAGADSVLGRTAVRAWLIAGTGAEHPPDLAAVDRVLDVAAGRAAATDVGAGWAVRRHQQRLRLVPPPAD